MYILHFCWLFWPFFDLVISGCCLPRTQNFVLWWGVAIILFVYKLYNGLTRFRSFSAPHNLLITGNVLHFLLFLFTAYRGLQFYYTIWTIYIDSAICRSSDHTVEEATGRDSNPGWAIYRCRDTNRYTTTPPSLDHHTSLLYEDHNTSIITENLVCWITCLITIRRVRAISLRTTVCTDRLPTSSLELGTIQ